MKDKLKTRKMQEERTLLVVTRLCVATKLQFFSFAVLLFAFFFLGTDAFMTGPRTTNETFVGGNAYPCSMHLSRFLRHVLLV